VKIYVKAAVEALGKNERQDGNSVYKAEPKKCHGFLPIVEYKAHR
jgi:hypothetical protein